jgi:hypothetical protein
MGAIIYDARRVKALQRLQNMGEGVGKSPEEIQQLWLHLVEDGALMKEFTYYLDNQALLDEVRCEGYGLTDLYMWLMARYNLRQDYGKNDASCDKERLVLDAFDMMAAMKKNPAPYVKMLGDSFGLGMDQLG